MPSPAPRTLALEKLVDQLSKLLWIQLPIAFLSSIQSYVNREGPQPISVTVIVLGGIVAGAIYAFVTWHYDSWINGLESRPRKLTLEKSGKQLHGLMNVYLFFGSLGLLSFGLQLFTTARGGTSIPEQNTLWTALQFVSTIFLIVGASAAKAWFRTGYTTEVLPQRSRLLLALRAYGVVTALQAVVYLITSWPLTRLTDWISLVLALVTNVIFLWAVFLTIKLVEATFGVSEKRPVESGTASL